MGAVLIVSLGCEGTDVERLYKTIQASGKPVEVIGIQELGGMTNAIAAVSYTHLDVYKRQVHTGKKKQ